MNPPGKIKIVTAHMEFPMCPSVYVGTTSAGETIRARYRFGRLVIRLDSPNAPCGAAAGAWIYDQQLDPAGLDGCMSYEDLRELTAELIDWPQELSRKIHDEDEGTWPEI